MITLNNVGKTYVSKNKNKVEALKGVSFELSSSGMTFILGKSGSGKSTLLNLLGGIDRPTFGSISVDNVDTQSFTQKDYESYRNGYVGFVFQEYNLLDDFNVKENIALALQLTKDIDVEQKVIQALKQVELTEEYLTRRVGELSGGEKQRVAIARAIVKDSKLILADEPTGNLDSETGKSIWNILKTLSQTHLVVTVTHDRESAELYADRIIEISDGKVFSDSCKNGVSADDATAWQKSNQSSRLPFKLRLKMAYNNLNLRKGKTVSVVLVAIFTILSMVIVQMGVCFSPERAIADYITDNGVDYISVGQSYYHKKDGEFVPSNSKPLYPSTEKYIAQNARYIKNNVIEGKQDILDMGLTFVGEALELDDESFYGTVDWYNQKCGIGLVEIDGEYVTIVKELHSMESLVGKKIRDDWSATDEYILAGIVDTGKVTNPSVFTQNNNEMFYNKNFKGHNYGYRLTFNNVYGDRIDRDIRIRLDGRPYDDEFSLSDENCLHHNTVLTADGIREQNYYDDGFELAENEIVLAYSLFAQLFGGNSKEYYIDFDKNEVRNMPSQIGQVYDLKFYSYDNGELLFDYGKVKIVGITFNKAEFNDDNKYKIWLNSDKCRRVCLAINPADILIQSSSVANMREFLTTLRREYMVATLNAGQIALIDTTISGHEFTDATGEFYAIELTVYSVSPILLAVCATLAVVLVLLVINLVSFSITSRKREIGILSAVGASNRDITGSFLLETAIIATISFILTLALSFVLIAVLNLLLSRAENISITLPLLSFDILSFAILVFASFGLMMIATLIPIRKIIKLKPIDAIRAL